MEKLLGLKPIVQWSYIVATIIATLATFSLALATMQLFDTRSIDYFSEVQRGITQFGMTGYVFWLILAAPIIEEFLTRTVTVRIGEVLSAPVIVIGLFSALGTTSIKMFTFGSPIMHFIIGIVLFALYMKHRSLPTNIFYSSLLNALALIILFTFSQIPSPAV
ncbi:type II CAAX prenyl endopeptidase Rce1 family protein [Psychrosphaera haliotis]|uniref:CAAX prenyl protease 2/Lysostaphin resistance protein A-like domain-containing protein n=1 Tax=Psychrosphaera haliotis TaxID=555083 RepID=A0A6N8FEV6_9GAMM|nr:CPBP family glutamic-type intramembrane protease [Psychrosphaera haliotis]MUH72781.1 hypothetical protein [Psychrosphaera haliotis]